MKNKALAYIFYCFGLIWFLCAWPIVGHAASRGTKKVMVPEPRIRNVAVLSKDSFEVFWTKRKSVDGYYICTIENGGRLKRQRTVQGAEVNHCVVRGLVYNKQYRFAVRAYREKNGENYRSDYNKKGYRARLFAKEVYQNGYKYYYDDRGNRIEDVEAFLEGSQEYQILVNTASCVTTVYARDGLRGFTIPVHAWLCSPGMHGNVLGVWNLGVKYRYRPLLYQSNSQWAERIHGDILIHTTPYTRYGTNNTLDVGEYNKLGTPASHGCIRMQCEATKWIYDHCNSHTKVVIYQNDDPGALGKPQLEPLPAWHTWDPTDPTAAGMCASHGCHQPNPWE